MVMTVKKWEQFEVLPYLANQYVSLPQSMFAGKRDKAPDSATKGFLTTRVIEEFSHLFLQGNAERAR